MPRTSFKAHPSSCHSKRQSLRSFIFLLILLDLSRLAVFPSAYSDVQRGLLKEGILAFGVGEELNESSKSWHDAQEKTAKRGHNDAEIEQASLLSNSLPVILNVGRGTTGTHLAIQGTCALGLPSIHWDQFCASIQMNKDSEAGLIIPKLQRWFLKTYWNPLKSCVHNPKKLPCPSTADWFEQTKDSLDRLLMSNSTLQAFHDTPFTSFIPYTVRRITELRGQLPLLILTERAPEEWARRRLETHASGKKKTGPPICKAFLNQNASDPTSWGLGEGVFDVFGCIDDGLRKNPNAELSDIFVSTANLGLEPGGEAQLARLMEDYQNAIRPHTIFSVNLFERQSRTSIGDFTEELSAAFSKFIRITQKEKLKVKMMNLYSDKMRFRTPKYSR